MSRARARASLCSPTVRSVASSLSMNAFQLEAMSQLGGVVDAAAVLREVEVDDATICALAVLEEGDPHDVPQRDRLDWREVRGLPRAPCADQEVERFLKDTGVAEHGDR